MGKKFFAVVGLICCLGLVIADAAKIGTRVKGEAKTVAAGSGVTKDGVKFVYKGAAKSVCIAGSFNEWNATKDALKETSPGVWTAVLPLSAKQYQYKFVVDGNWVVDDLNPAIADDGFGGKNSVIEVTQAVEVKKVEASGPAAIKEGTKFTYKGKAGTVYVAGSFNDWNMAKNVLKEVKPGEWETVLPLVSGQYQYKFIVDGNWITDPENSNLTDDGLGGKNSVVSVEKGIAEVQAKGPTAVKEGTKFSLKASDAMTVFLAGAFNNWSTNSDSLSKDSSGIWTITKKLKSGKYNYKFIVDGNWMLDPENKDTSDDGFGGKNSVVEVK